MSLTDRDARLLYKQQLDAGVLPLDAPPQANSLADVHRCDQDLAGRIAGLGAWSRCNWSQGQIIATVHDAM